MKITTLRAKGLGVALALFFSNVTLGAPESRRQFGPSPLDEADANLLVTSTVIKVLEIWPGTSLEITNGSALQLELWPDGGKLSQRATLAADKLDIDLNENRIRVRAGGKSALTSKVALTGYGMKVKAVAWPRRVDILPGAKGKLWVVYHMNLEDYVARVLPHEMSLSWPEEALKAQAVAVRTYATYQMARHQKRAFHVHSTTTDQVFRMEPVKGPWAGKLARVMAATKGQILTDSLGKVASIFYHADCGGSVEQTPWVWNEHLTASRPIQCAPHPHLSWKLEVTDKELAQKLAAGHREISSGHIDGVQSVKTSPSGRVEELRILLDSGVALNMRPEELRKVLGPDHLKSARFIIKPIEDGVEFIGQGYGHGVGLCQRGSKAWAQQGKMSSEILKIYYPTLRVAQVWSPSRWSTARRESYPRQQ